MHRSPCTFRAVIASLSLMLAAALPALAVPWPYQPFDQAHGLGNHYGEYQNYGGSPYYHDGIDLVTPTGPVAVYSVSDGFLTHITYSDPLYSGLMIGELVANGHGWLYWHISSATMQFDYGDRVYTNDYVGTTAYWPVASFHHCHFNKVQGSGGLPWAWYVSTENPLELVEPHPDSDPPTLPLTYVSQRFGFVRQGANVVLNPESLSGDVDIIAKIGDVVGMPQWILNPWKVEYWIDGAVADVPVTNSVTFSGLCPTDETVSTIYRTQAPMKTEGNYDYRDFYFIVTNTDGDGAVEISDGSLCWHAGAAGAGDYWVYVRAYDLGGNATADSMRVTVAGTVNPDIYLPETSHDFGSVALGSTETWAMAVQNVGPDYLSVRSVAVNNPNFSVGRKHFFVAPGGTETLLVSFTPPAQHRYSGTLELTTNDPDEPLVTVSLAGEGADPSGVSMDARDGRLQLLGAHTLPGAGLGVRFALARPGDVTVSVHDVSGRRVRGERLIGRAAGAQDWTWDGTDDGGVSLGSGVYFVRIVSGDERVSGAGVLLR
jgi:hypothetical protein